MLISVLYQLKYSTNLSILLKYIYQIIFLQEFLQPLSDLMLHFEEFMDSETGQQLAIVFQFLSQNSWPDIYDQLIETESLEKVYVTLENCACISIYCSSVLFNLTHFLSKQIWSCWANQYLDIKKLPYVNFIHLSNFCNTYNLVFIIWLT